MANRDHQNCSKSSIKFEHREQYHRDSLKVRLEFQTYILAAILREDNDPLNIGMRKYILSSNSEIREILRI